MAAQAQTLDSEASVQILSLLLTCYVLGEGPSPLPVPQFPHLRMRLPQRLLKGLGYKYRNTWNSGWHMMNEA